MGLDSLLTSLNRGVAGVADVQALQHKAFACNGRESADVAGVAVAMPGADAATAATAHKNSAVTRKPLQHKACTPATSATAEIIEVRNDAAEVGTLGADIEPIDREAWDERAAIAEFDGGLSRADAEALAWAEDDRRRCRQCLNLRGAVCSIAAPGGLVSASKGYRPANLPMRCAGYSPSLREADQRTGAERWPGLSEGQRAAA